MREWNRQWIGLTHGDYQTRNSRIAGLDLDYTRSDSAETIRPQAHMLDRKSAIPTSPRMARCREDVKRRLLIEPRTLAVAQ